MLSWQLPAACPSAGRRKTGVGENELIASAVHVEVGTRLERGGAGVTGGG
jgi:hypothetical protein